MNTLEASVHLLRRHNRWRRGDDTVEMPDPALLGCAIDVVCDYIEKQSLATIQDSHQSAVPDRYVLVPLSWFEREIPRLDAGGPNPIQPDEHCCEWALYQERYVLKALKDTE